MIEHFTYVPTERLLVSYKADVTPIRAIKNGDWLDLRTAEDVHMKAGEFKLISLGVAIQTPTGYEALVVPRSSTFGKYGILMTNSIGVIEESYCGDEDIWRFPAFAIRDTFIPADTRICQFRVFEHQPVLDIITCDILGNDSRGGFGSTGER